MNNGDFHSYVATQKQQTQVATLCSYCRILTSTFSGVAKNGSPDPGTTSHRSTLHGEHPAILSGHSGETNGKALENP
jgi:hypothetical protein